MRRAVGLLLLVLLRALGGLFRLLYGFHIEGVANLPPRGPYLIIINETSLLATILDAVAIPALLPGALGRGQVLSFAAEEFWAIPGVNWILSTLIGASPAVPHGAGIYGLGMLRALEQLQNGGIVVMNPEGDTNRDGRPIQIRNGPAWLALHSGAPVVPFILDSGTYDIWPSWQLGPSRSGRTAMRIGKPFKLAEKPQEAVSDSELAEANGKLRRAVDELAYGPGGIGGWAGVPSRNGEPVADLERRMAAARATVRDRPKVRVESPVFTRGMPLLLWRCPVCLTDDALVHHRPWFREQTLECKTCGTLWQVKRNPGCDFRLRVVKGPEDLMGVEMALSAWYDSITRDFQPEPIPAEGVELAPGEELFLRTSRALLLVYTSSAISQGWTGREPPAHETRRRPADWVQLGEGRLILTSKRLAWDGAKGGLDLDWSRVTALRTGLYYLFIVNYGVTPYRFHLPRDNAHKWLVYAGTIAPPIAAAQGHRITLTGF